MTPTRSHYEVLGVDTAATTVEIRKAYRSLALESHPDKVDEKNREAATERFKCIAVAYNILSDPEQRAEYDLQQASPVPHPASATRANGPRTWEEMVQMHAQARFHDDYLRRFGPMAAERMGPGGHARGNNMEGFDHDSWFAAQEQAAQAAQASFARSGERAREHVRRQSASAPRRPPSYNAPPFIFPGRSPYVDDWEPPLGTLDTPFGRRANLDELDVFNPRTLEDMDLEYTAVQIQHEMDRRRRPNA
ncbi:uncharacterized protein EHS24_008810 [Apiotrichum porosum]|uniref:J domain-containing protein n=1 Tax=Apiotrichum porosum TaxID=105984 RepID=A0A427XNF0_9TREE|nr:uncharacterized protein EHS24_008810 [Apiotrichum porosum]RSH80237.1 hypothetical protein EHS24_008810 [Apiotrichum porosum]